MCPCENAKLMELGALVCAARKPRCERCPLGDVCQAHDGSGPALAGARGSPREKVAGTSCRYEDSNRFLRGRVLAKLHEAPEEGVSLRDLGTVLHDGSENVNRLLPVIRSLEECGLATIYERRPPCDKAEAVAETRPAYGAERLAERENRTANSETVGETRVKLP